MGLKVSEEDFLSFPPYKSMGIRVPIQSALKPYAVMIVYIKFDQNWPIDFRDIHFENVTRRQTTTDCYSNISLEPLAQKS